MNKTHWGSYSPHTFIEEEMQANLWREHTNDYIQLRLKIDFCEPNDVDAKAHLDLWDQSNMVKYDWVDSK